MKQREKLIQEIKRIPAATAFSPMAKKLPILKFFGSSILCFSSMGYAEQGLIGGITGTSGAYAAFVDVPSGNLTPVVGLPANVGIFSVGINRSGNGIIAGSDGSGGYAALVRSDGTFTPLSTPSNVAQFNSSAINESGYSLIGGRGFFFPYAASVTSDGIVTPFTLSNSDGYITSVAVNDDALGLIGGEGDIATMYAAYISASGSETVLSLPTNSGGTIHSVAINCRGNGIVGGDINLNAYGALTTNGQSAVIPLSLTFPAARINAVAINDAGLGLIAGDENPGGVFAGYTASNGDVTLLPIPILGSLTSAAINSSGKGIIGGADGANVYAAFVTPSGSVTPLIASPPPGTIFSVAIDDNGVGIFGGQAASSGYAALVAPNGALTFLDVSSQDSIHSVALEAVLNEVVRDITPKSIGFWNSTFFTQLSASTALEWRFVEQNKIWQRSCLDTAAQCDKNPTSASSSTQPSRRTPFWTTSREAVKDPETSSPSCQSSTKNSVWIAPFGDFVRVKKQGDLPRVENNIGGVLLAYDRQGDNFLVGGALGYAHNSMHYGSGNGHGKMQEEMATVYGAYYSDHFWFDAALWGGVYQWSNVRHAKSQLITSIGACNSSLEQGPSLKSKGKTHGWILSPHFEMAMPWALDNRQHYFIEPFALFDWVYCWQDSFKERGSSGFNVKMKNLHGSLLQSEVGLRFYEKFMYCWGDFLLEEKVSYVNQAPFFHKKVKTGFVGSTGSFPVAVGSTKVQNLGSVALMATFVPLNKSFPFGGLGFQANGNRSYQSYDITLFTGWDY